MANTYIQNEPIIPDGINPFFALANNFKAGTLLINYNGRLFYEFFEDKTIQNIVSFDFIPLVTDQITVSYYLPSQPNTLNATRYITTRQVVNLSRVVAIENENVVFLERFCREAERYIDALVGYYKKYYENLSSQSGQIRTFPRVKDDPILSNTPTVDYPFIPAEITQAALYSVENLFLTGVQTEAENCQGPTTSVKKGDFSYTKQALGFGKGQKDFFISLIGRKAYSMLSGFIKKTGTLAEENIVDNSLNSRQLKLISNPFL